MSLYHETVDILSITSSPGGNLKTRIFGYKNKNLKSPKQQIYALALETCKWSSVLKEVIDGAELLRHERKLTPLLALLLVHDFLLSRKGIALPISHGLRTAVERHKARLTAELTRARLRRKAGSIDALRQLNTAEYLGEVGLYPRWVRVNTIKTTLQDQLDTTFKDFTRVANVQDVVVTNAGSSAVAAGGRLLYVDEHVPDLLALTPTFEITKTQAYALGAVILQDKASCFPAYLLDPRPEDGDVIDSCSAPGNKTTHVVAIVKSHATGAGECRQKVYAFEKDQHRSRTLEKMVNLAGAQETTRMSLGRDFLKVDPHAPVYKNVGALLLDPSCSGSGIVGRDAMPTIHLPEPFGGAITKKPTSLDTNNRKRKREDKDVNQVAPEVPRRILIDDDGQETVVTSEKDMKARLEALSSFQLTLILHAFAFPAARKVTYSTCSVHAEENEQVVLKALQSEVAMERGWRILTRDQQVRGMREWPVRGSLEASTGNEEVAAACIRSYKDDGRGVMGFFVAGFSRDPGAGANILGNCGEETTPAGRLPNQNTSILDAPEAKVTERMNTLGESSSGSNDTDDPDRDSDTDANDSSGDEWDGFAD